MKRFRVKLKYGTVKTTTHTEEKTIVVKDNSPPVVISSEGKTKKSTKQNWKT